MDRVIIKQAEKESIEKLKNRIIDDDDRLQVDLLEYFGYNPESLNISFADDTILARDGRQGNDIGVAIVSGGQYENPEQINEQALENIWETYSTIGSNESPNVTIITNSGVDLYSRSDKRDPRFKNFRVIKVPSAL